MIQHSCIDLSNYIQRIFASNVMVDLKVDFFNDGEITLFFRIERFFASYVQSCIVRTPSLNLVVIISAKIAEYLKHKSPIFLREWICW